MALVSQGATASSAPVSSVLTPAIAFQDLAALTAQLGHPDNLRDLGVLALCLAAAWLMIRAWRGREPGDVASIWLGHHVVDGVLFPVMALTFTYVARRLLGQGDPSTVLRVAVPMLVSLVVIRLTVKVLRGRVSAARIMLWSTALGLPLLAAVAHTGGAAALVVVFTGALLSLRAQVRNPTSHPSISSTTGRPA